VIFDCFGDFEGFVLRSCGETHHFRSREKGIGELVLRACRHGLSITVLVRDGSKDQICEIIVRCGC